MAAKLVDKSMKTNDILDRLKITKQGLWKMRQEGRYPQPDFYVGRHPRWFVETHADWITKHSRS